MAKTIQQIQSLITNKYDAREVINEIADYLQANSSALPYKVYTAILSTTATDNIDPTTVITANILQNTLGFVPTIVRDAAGQYYLEGNFGPNAWFVFQSPGAYFSGVNFVLAEQLINQPGYPSNIIFFTTASSEPFSLIDLWETTINVEIRIYE